jgi:hypothetical protein
LQQRNGLHDLSKEATDYMRQSNMAIADMAITEREAPRGGLVSGTAVARNGTHVAVATAPNNFVVLDLDGSIGNVVVGTRVQVRFERGRGTLEIAELGRGW